MIENINGKGNDEFEAQSNCVLKGRTMDEFSLIINGAIVAPNNSTERWFKTFLNPGDKMELYTSGHWTYNIALLKSSGEKNSGEILLDEDEEMSMYDRLRAEMMQKISDYADSKGLDSFEDDDDFDDDFESEHLSHYEKKEMAEEWLRDNNMTSDQLLNPKLKPDPIVPEMVEEPKADQKA